MEIKNFYFTYGSWEGFPYSNGWTKIEAPDRKSAVTIFRALHPDKTEGVVNCSSIYDEETFHKTEMWRTGNFGAHEVEVVLMQHITLAPF